jgi:hypothetical protein
VAAGAGYAQAERRPDQPATDDAEPVPASSPSYPAIPVLVLPDPAVPPLEPGRPLHQVTVGTAPYDFSLPIPAGWLRSNPISSEWHWYPPPEFVKNTYFVRVKLFGNAFLPVAAARDARLSALENADDVRDLHVESRDANTLVTNYVADQHRRVSMEAFLPNSDGDAYASIAVIGREADRAGLADLFQRVTAGAVVPSPS